MGSRITRSVFREERARPLDRSRNQQIETLTLSFLSFISLLTCFFQGYLYRPYQHSHLYLLLFLPILPSFPPVLSAVTLLLTFILTWAFGVHLHLLKGTLLLTSFFIGTAVNGPLLNNLFGNSFFYYLCYCCFVVGWNLSNFAHSGEGQEGMMVKIMFSLMILMGSYLVGVGLRFLRRNVRFKPYYWGPSNSLTFFMGTILLLTGQQIFLRISMSHLLSSTLIVILLVVLGKKLQWSTANYVSILLLIWGSNIVEIATQAEESLLWVVCLCRGVGTSLGMIEGAKLTFDKQMQEDRKKRNWMSGLFFVGFYFSTLDDLSFLLHGNLFILLQLVFTGALVFLWFYHIKYSKEQSQIVI